MSFPPRRYHAARNDDGLAAEFARLVSQATNPPVDLQRVEHLLDDAALGLDAAFQHLVDADVSGDALKQLRVECLAVGCRALAAAAVVPPRAQGLDDDR